MSWGGRAERGTALNVGVAAAFSVPTVRHCDIWCSR